MEDKRLHSNFDYESALNVQKGIEQPDIINNSYLSRMRAIKKAEPTVEELVAGILEGNRTLLSRAITLVESTLPAHQDKAQAVIERCLPYSGKSIRLGITGVPGAGKSTTIEALGTMLTSRVTQSGNLIFLLFSIIILLSCCNPCHGAYDFPCKMGLFAFYCS